MAKFWVAAVADGDGLKSVVHGGRRWLSPARLLGLCAPTLPLAPGLACDECVPFLVRLSHSGPQTLSMLRSSNGAAVPSRVLLCCDVMCTIAVQ